MLVIGTSEDTARFLVVVRAKSQPRPSIAGRPIYLGERKLAVATCRDKVVEAVGALAGRSQ